jgi:hypothetical protein
MRTVKPVIPQRIAERDREIADTAIAHPKLTIKIISGMFDVGMSVAAYALRKHNVSRTLGRPKKVSRG